MGYRFFFFFFLSLFQYTNTPLRRGAEEKIESSFRVVVCRRTKRKKRFLSIDFAESEWTENNAIDSFFLFLFLSFFLFLSLSLSSS